MFPSGEAWFTYCLGCEQAILIDSQARPYCGGHKCISYPRRRYCLIVKKEKL